MEKPQKEFLFVGLADKSIFIQSHNFCFIENVCHNTSTHNQNLSFQVYNEEKMANNSFANIKFSIRCLMSFNWKLQLCFARRMDFQSVSQLHFSATFLLNGKLASFFSYPLYLFFSRSSPLYSLSLFQFFPLFPLLSALPLP